MIVSIRVGTKDVPTLRMLNADQVAILRTAQIREQMVRQGAKPTPGTSAEFTVFLKNEIVACGRVIRDAGLRAQ